MSTSPIPSTSATPMSDSPADPPASAPLLTTSDEATLSATLETASSLLRSHLPVAFPTETVYGLGASALSSTAVKRIFAAKGRPSDNPLIVHIGSREMLENLLPRPASVTGKGKGKQVINPMYEALMERFWPGPLSLIFSLDHSTDSLSPPLLEVAPEVTANLPSLCIRMPSHPLALALLRQSNLPLAAPSANLSSRPSPTSARHVMNDLGAGRGVGAIIDGGECTVGVESTVVDYVEPEEEGQLGRLRVLRAGGVSAEDIEECLKDAGFSTSSTSSGIVQVYHRDFKSTSLESNPTTPGMKYKHYSPGNSKVILVKPNSTDGPTKQFLPSLQDLIQLSALTQGREGKGFRVGLMLTKETLSQLSPTTIDTSSPSTTTTTNEENEVPKHLERITLPTPPPSLFAQLAPNEDSNLPPLSQIEVWSYSLGGRSEPEQAAMRLFAGLRWFDSMPRDQQQQEGEGEGKESDVGVDLILVEAIEEKGVGLAVMERARKAAGGGTGGEMEFAL